ncbi:hypothetical protein [Peptoniphilus harei]|uniref:hypothetical protein n=1 Tax=Peptoniphilus harei TaxID=54005 RepID=UPI00211394AC|nr:hypothetical protein [Peptoniphilus harei]
MDLSYTDLAHKILSLYLTDFDKDDLLGLIEKSYASFEDELQKFLTKRIFTWNFIMAGLLPLRTLHFAFFQTSWPMPKISWYQGQNPYFDCNIWRHR